jgi:uncharacterized protein (TIGR03382 family)
MITSYHQFLVEHGSEHLTSFNRGCACVGNPMTIAGPVLMLFGRRKTGAALTASGVAIVVSGHVAEGNLPQNIRVFFRHPIWSLRADFDVARQTITHQLRARGAAARVRSA